MNPDPPLADRVREKHARLQAMRPLPPETLRQLDAWYDVELTYTSNAIEGNTLTRQETALVLEKGLTVRGKPLKYHQEATDHLDALKLVRALADSGMANTEASVCDIHRLVIGSTMSSEAGLYSRHPRRIAGSMVVFPNPAKVPDLMESLGRWLEGADVSAESAIEAHLRLVSIHPFSDGNGRAARLLLNLMLLRAGFPPLVVRPEDRIDYLEAIEQTQLTGQSGGYKEFMQGRLEASLDDYLSFITPDDEPSA